MALMRAGRPRVSYADLERMANDGRRYEIVDGDLFDVTPAPSPLHQRVSKRRGPCDTSTSRGSSSTSKRSGADAIAQGTRSEGPPAFALGRFGVAASRDTEAR